MFAPACSEYRVGNDLYCHALSVLRSVSELKSVRFTVVRKFCCLLYAQDTCCQRSEKTKLNAKV